MDYKVKYIKVPVTIIGFLFVALLMFLGFTVVALVIKGFFHA